MTMKIHERDTYVPDFEAGFKAGINYVRGKYDKIVERMIIAGEDIEKIVEYTEFTREEVEEVRENLKLKLNGWCVCSKMEMEQRVKYEEGMEEGLKRAKEISISNIVSTLKDMNVSTEMILEEIQEKFNLSLEDAQKYV